MPAILPAEFPATREAHADLLDGGECAFATAVDHRFLSKVTDAC